MLEIYWQMKRKASFDFAETFQNYILLKMNKKLQLSVYLLVCAVLIVFSLYTGQRNHHNCDKCNWFSQAGHDTRLVISTR